MTKRHLMTLRILLMLADGVAAVLVFLFVSYVRFQEGDPTAVWSVGIDVPVAAMLFAVVWVSALFTLGLYRLRVRWSLFTEARDIARATLLVVALTLSMLFILHQDDVSRLFLAIVFVTQPVVTLAGRALLRSWFNTLRRRGMNTNYMLIAGTGALAQRFADSVEAHTGLGMRVVGHLSVPTQRRRATDGDTPTLPQAAEIDEQSVTRPIIGSIDEMGAVFRARIIDEVAVCLPPASAYFLEPIIAMAADEGKTVRVPSDPDQEVLSYAVQEEFEGFLVRSVVHDTQREVELAIKRILDIAGAIVGLLVLSPVLVGAALVLRAREGSPVLFRQTRIGRHGRAFTIYKFRTMIPGAEEKLEAVRHLNERRGAAFKATNDPRVTPFGRWLRKTSIDELPQLWNVLQGSMSLVGPRPPLPSEVEEYDIWHRRRLSMRPGITGLWQVEARHETDFNRWVERDLAYIDSWSIWLDLKILARTIPALMAREGH